jgi:hypothetical protein
MNELVFTPRQQVRFDKALEDYWKEPAHVTFRNEPWFKDESVLFATWAARANVMTDDEFNAIMSELFKRGQESGDVGGEYYSHLISNLNELRRLPI